MPLLRQNSCRSDTILSFGTIKMKDGTVWRNIQERSVGRLLPPKSANVGVEAKEIGAAVQTLELWHENAQSGPAIASGSLDWSNTGPSTAPSPGLMGSAN